MHSLLFLATALLASAHEPADFINVDVQDLVPEILYPQPPAAPHATAIPSGGVPCTSTLTVTAPTDCSGCTTTSYAATSTAEVDCHGCGVLTTTTV